MDHEKSNLSKFRVLRVTCLPVFALCWGLLAFNILRVVFLTNHTSAIFWGCNAVLFLVPLLLNLRLLGKVLGGQVYRHSGVIQEVTGLQSGSTAVKVFALEDGLQYTVFRAAAAAHTLDSGRTVDFSYIPMRDNYRLVVGIHSVSGSSPTEA